MTGTYIVGDKIVRMDLPTYEQHIVHMFREAKAIVDVGTSLRNNLASHRAHMRYLRANIDNCRAGMGQHPYKKSPIYFKRWRDDLLKFHAEFLLELDRLWLAQGKYEAWAKTYGDI